jgi:hypothetical protein
MKVHPNVFDTVEDNLLFKLIKLQEIRTSLHASEHIAHVIDDASTDFIFRAPSYPGMPWRRIRRYDECVVRSEAKDVEVATV